MASARAIRAGAAYIEALLDDTKFVRGIRMLANKTRQIASQLQLGGLFTGAVGGAISAFGLNVLKLAGNAQEVQNRFNAVFDVVQNGRVVFEGFRQDAEEFANLLASAANRSSFQLKDMMSRFQSIVLGFGFARREALTFSKALTRLTLDLASFEDVSDSEAAQKLLSGLAGEIEPVRRAGIPINQTTVDAELKRMGVMSTAKGATEAQKATARVTIMLLSMSESFKNATNDVFRTADNFTNIFRGLQGAFYDFRVAVGSTMLVVASQWGKRLTQMLRQATAFVQKFSGLVLLFFKAGLALAILGPAMITASVAMRQVAFWANVLANVFAFLNARATTIIRIALAPALLAWRAAALATSVAMRVLSAAIIGVRLASAAAYNVLTLLAFTIPVALVRSMFTFSTMILGVIGPILVIVGLFNLAGTLIGSWATGLSRIRGGLDSIRDRAGAVAKSVQKSARDIATATTNAATKAPGMAVKAWETIKVVAGKAAAIVMRNYVQVRDAVLQVYDAIKNAFLAGDLELAATIAFKAVHLVWVETLAFMFNNLDEWIVRAEGLWIGLKDKALNAWSGMKDWFANFVVELEYVWNKSIDKLVSKLDYALEDMKASWTTFYGVFEGFLNNIRNGMGFFGAPDNEIDINTPATEPGNAFDEEQKRKKKTEDEYKRAKEEAEAKATPTEFGDAYKLAEVAKLVEQMQNIKFDMVAEPGQKRSIKEDLERALEANDAGMFEKRLAKAQAKIDKYASENGLKTDRPPVFKDDAVHLSKQAEKLRKELLELKKAAQEAAAKVGNDRLAAEKEFLKKYGGEGIASPGGFGGEVLKTFGTVSGRDARQMFGASAIPQQQLTQLQYINRNLRRLQGLQNNPQNVKLAVPVVN